MDTPSLCVCPSSATIFLPFARSIALSQKPGVVEERMQGSNPLPEKPPPRPSSVGLVWGLKSTLCERLPSLLGIAEKRENSFIQAVNEMSFAIHFHGHHVADPQHPRVAPAHTEGGCYFGGSFVKWGKCTKASKHDRPIRRVWGLCLPWVLLPSEVAQGTRQG